MDQDRPQLTFGRYLQSIRLAKGIELDTVAAATRIAPRILAFIEAEDHDQLPAEVFVKGFLRAYARQVGADGDDVVARYLAERPMAAPAEHEITPTAGRPPRFWLRLLLVLSGLAAIIAVTVTLVSSPEPAPPAPEMRQDPVPLPPSSAVLKAPAVVTDAKGSAASATVAERPEVAAEDEADTDPPAPAVPESRVHRLEVKTLAPTWVKIIADRRPPEEYSLKTGDRLDLEALTGFHLLVGNAAGVVLTLDGDPVAIEGREGQVVRLTLP